MKDVLEQVPQPYSCSGRDFILQGMGEKQRRQAAELRGKAFCEIRWVVEAHLECDLGNVSCFPFQQQQGFFQSQIADQVIGRSPRQPVDLIRDLRLEKALLLLKRKAGNVSEIAF